MYGFVTALAPLTSLAAALAKVSAQAALLIALVLLLQRVLGKRLAPRVRYALWLLVVARLLLPVSLESGVSVFNITLAAPAEVFRAVAAASKPSSAKVDGQNAPASTASAASAPVPSSSPAAGTADHGRSAAAVAPAAAKVSGIDDSGDDTRPLPSVWGSHFPWAMTLSLGWLAGVVFLLARIIVIPLRLNAQLARHETPTAPGVFEILEESKRLSGVNQVLPIVQSRAVASAALLGFIRPWLLLPEGLVGRFTPQELRLVFLHELAHLKRRDIAVNWLATLLQILHWPNPLVWLAFARMRADRELACDELALSFAHSGESESYGHAIIKLLEGFTRPAALPGLVGILEDQTQMKKRITMIAQFKKMSGWSAAAAGLVLGLGVVTLTDGQTEKTSRAAPTPLSSASIKTLISGTTRESRGTLSPDEKYFAYDVAHDPARNKADLAVRDMRTGEVVTLPTDGPRGGQGWPSDVLWSPDTTRIAYAFSWSPDESWEHDEQSVRIVARAGGAPKVIFQEANATFTPEDWSPTADVLAGVWAVGNDPTTLPQLALLAIATGEVRKLGPVLAHARFSPDAKFLVGVRQSTEPRHLVMVDVERGTFTDLTQGPMQDGTPAFSADGRFVVFSSDRHGVWDLWAVRVQNGRALGEPFVVKYDFGNHAKRTTLTGKLVFHVGGSGSDVFAVNANQSSGGKEAGLRKLSQAYNGHNFSPMWSPDGKTIAYLRTGGAPNSRNALVLQSTAGQTERTIDPGLARCNRMFWSPDSQSLALMGIAEGRSGSWGIYIVSIRDGKRLIDHLRLASENYWPLAFGNDGKDFIFFDNMTKTRVAIDLATKQERAISGAAEKELLPSADDYDFTPDGTKAVVARKRGGERQIVVLDATSGELRVVAHATSEMMSPRWSPDGTKIAYYATHVVPEKGGRHELRICAADGSWDRTVDVSGRFVGNATLPPSWSPDSNQFVLTLVEETPTEIDVLENFLPPEKLAAK